MEIAFTAMQTLSRHFLILPFNRAHPPSALCHRLIGQKNGTHAESVILYKCEKCSDGTSLFEAHEYGECGEKAPLCADGVRALSAYLAEKDVSLPHSLRILSDGEIKSARRENTSDGRQIFSVALPAPSFEANRVGLTEKAPLLGQKIPIGHTSYPFYALAVGAFSFAISFKFGTALELLHPSSLALSVRHIFTRPFSCVFVELTGEDSLALRIFSPEKGELDASSEGAAAAVSAAHLLGYLPVGCDIHATMRGGRMYVRADAVGAPMQATAEASKSFEGVISSEKSPSSHGAF